MKLAVIADTHLGFQYGAERGEDAFINARDAFEKALACEPDYILLLGDIFDHRVEKPEVLSKAMQLFKDVNKSIRSDHILAIYGTHETRHKDAVNPVQLLAQAGLLTLLHKQSVLLEKDNQRVGIFGLSGVHDSFAKDELQSWNPQPYPNAYNIFLLHQTFKEDIPQLNDVLTYQDLSPAFNLYLFGHIHYQHEKAIDSTPILYPGSTIRTQLGRNTTQKLGFYILEIQNNQLTRKEFIPLTAPREFIHIELDVSNNSPSEILIALDQKLSTALPYSNKNRKPLVKIKLVGKLKKGFAASDLQLTSIQKKYKEACYLKIDKSKTESESSKERLKFLADLGQKQESIESLGIELLIQNLKETNIPKQKLAELFEKLSEGELEASEALLTSNSDVSKDSKESVGIDQVSKTQESSLEDQQQGKIRKEGQTPSWQETFDV